MYLKRLDLQGFKSFPEKIKLEFNKGITTVVGPNGSGKSNVSDAVRWVLGEQRVKSLRGDKMEDVIFAGTSNRRPLGFAEVSITVDNIDRKIPLDYTDITISRTVYRSGESRYMINGTVCRLKDIHELFLDTGVGKEGYSIIGQGRIDEILSSKDEDRRHLFEEATGIAKFRNRRFEAINKLEKEQQNLLRVEDIISELESKIEPLKEQSDIAKKYLALKAQLRQYDINSFCIQADKIEKIIQELNNYLEVYNNNIEDEKIRNGEIRKKISENKEKEEKYLAELQKLNEDIAKLSMETEKNDGKMKLCEQEILHINENVKRIEEEKIIKENSIEEYKNEKTVHISHVNAIEINIASLNEKLKAEDEKFDKLSNFLKEGEEKIETYKAEMIDSMQKVSSIKSNISHLETMNDQFSERLEQVAKESDYVQSQVLQTKTRFAVLEKQISENSDKKAVYKDEISELTKKITLITACIEKNQIDYRSKLSKLNESSSKLKVLKEMENDFEGFYRSVKSILKLRGTSGFEGVCGAVGELISVDKKFEVAVEIALGQAVQNIVIENEDDAKTAIEYLKKNKLGRSTFLPLNVVKGKTVEDDGKKIVQAKGFLGIAKDVVTYDKKYEPIMSNLLSRVVVMENMDTALYLANATKYKYKLVTIDGDVVNPGGTMTGGSMSAKTSNIFGRSREIKELETNIASFEKEVKDVAENIQKNEEELKSTKGQLLNISESVQQINISLATMEQETIQCKNTISEKQEQYNSSVLEEKMLSEQIAAANNDVFELKMKTKDAEEDIEKVNKILEEYQVTVQGEKIEKEEALKRITDVKVSISVLEQEKSSVNDNINRIAREIVKAETEDKSFSQQKDEYRKAEEAKKQEIVSLLDEIDELTNRQKSFESFKEEMNEKFLFIKSHTESLEEGLQEHFEILNKLESSILKTQMKLERNEEEKERIYNSIWDEYEITYTTAKEQFDSSITNVETNTITKQIKNEIKTLGDVNVNAIEEYKGVKERYDFLTLQRDDIKNAEEKLNKAIDDLAIMMQKQFKEQFEVINENFNAVFKEMFGGGTAYLKLADEKNVLESGIEIIAQPPGKTLQNMMLLSGGERALTAIAILFGILKMKPSPFCILDEIEAALDEANVKRFADYLKRFAEGTQFIIITHRKGTMEAADVMYGVTMQEQGVSKVISIKFDENANKGEVV